MQIDTILYGLPLLYILLINIIAICAIWWDKRRAIHHEWRISEATLLLIGIFGGALGIIGGMYRFRHKTQKRSFQAIAFLGLVISLIIYWLVLTIYL